MDVTEPVMNAQPVAWGHELEGDVAEKQGVTSPHEAGAEKDLEVGQ
jgi:hypothetical protein